jgi:hypothetical protein
MGKRWVMGGDTGDTVWGMLGPHTVGPLSA